MSAYIVVQQCMIINCVKRNDDRSMTLIACAARALDITSSLLFWAGDCITILSKSLLKYSIVYNNQTVKLVLKYHLHIFIFSH